MVESPPPFFLAILVSFLPLIAAAQVSDGELVRVKTVDGSKVVGTVSDYRYLGFSGRTLAAYPQAIDSDVPVSISIQGGISLSKVTIPESEEGLVDYGYRRGINIRAYAFLPISSKLGMQLGLGYMQKGASADIAGLESFGIQINYIPAPVLLAVNPTRSIRLLAGPVFSFALGCSVESEGETFGSSSVDCDVDSELKTVDISIMGGIGLNNIPVAGKLSFSLNAAYDLGITDYAKNHDSKHRSFMITAGLSLPLAR